MALLHRQEREVAGGAAHGSLNGTSEVELVPDDIPDGHTRVVEDLRFVNVDTARVTIRVRKVESATPYQVDVAKNLAVDGVFRPLGGEDGELRLLQGETVTALMAAAAATTNPTWAVSWRDEPIP